MAENKVTRLREQHEGTPAGELSPRDQVQQAVSQKALTLLAMDRLSMRPAITELDLETTRKALTLEFRNLRRRDVLAMLRQQELLQVMGDNDCAVIIRRRDLNTITNALLLAREHAHCPLDSNHREAMRTEIDQAVAILGEMNHG